MLVLYGVTYILTATLSAIDNTFYTRAVYSINRYIDVSESRHLSGMVGVLLGLYLMILGRGLYRRYRRSWWAAILVLLLLCANSFVLSSQPAMGLFSLGLICVLLFSYRLFSARPDYAIMNYQKFMAWVSVLLALSYGILGSYFLRNEFAHLQTWTDAVYYTFVTYSTVGFGDIIPITQNAKYFTVSMIVIGLGSFAAAASFVIGPMIEQRMKGVLNLMKKFHNISGHIVICGYSSIGKILVKRCLSNNTPFIIIDGRPEVTAEIQALGYSFVPCSSTQRQSFEQANLLKAQAVVVAFDNDAENILTLLTVNNMLDGVDVNKRPDLVVRVDHEENVVKAQHLGVQHIVSPALMAADAMLAELKRSAE